MPVEVATRAASAKPTGDGVTVAGEVEHHAEVDEPRLPAKLIARNGCFFVSRQPAAQIPP
jgi:hypothetical protein